MDKQVQAEMECNAINDDAEYIPPPGYKTKLLIVKSSESEGEEEGENGPPPLEYSPPNGYKVLVLRTAAATLSSSNKEKSEPELIDITNEEDEENDESSEDEEEIGEDMAYTPESFLDEGEEEDEKDPEPRWEGPDNWDVDPLIEEQQKKMDAEYKAIEEKLKQERLDRFYIKRRDLSIQFEHDKYHMIKKFRDAKKQLEDERDGKDDPW